MTKDDLISMAKATEGIVEETTAVINLHSEGLVQTNSAITILLNNMQAVATIQRDLIKGLLGT